MKRIIMSMAMAAALLFSAQAYAQVDKQGSTTRQPMTRQTIDQTVRSDRDITPAQQARQGNAVPGTSAAPSDRLQQDTSRRKRDTARVPTPMPTPTPTPRDTMRK
jgi:hypothetical protein